MQEIDPDNHNYDTCNFIDTSPLTGALSLIFLPSAPPSGLQL